jgi:hypothetical protein
MVKSKKTNLFSPTSSVVKKGTAVALCMIMTGLFFIAGCKKDNEKKPIEEPEYPIEIPFTEYSLAENCQWTNLAYDNTVIVINSDETLEKYVSCTGDGYLEIDFSKQTLLLANGWATNGIHFLDIHFSKEAANEYILNVSICTDATAVAPHWLISIITPKISNVATIILNVQKIND